MPNITVARPFTLQMDPPVVGYEKGPADKENETTKPIYGTPDKWRFVPGTYDVSEEIANHWYTKAHLVGFEPPAPAAGTHQFAQESLLAAQGVRMMQPVSQQGQTPAPLPDDVKVMRPGEMPEGAHYFAGQPQEDKPMPGREPQASTQSVSFLADKPAGPTKGKGS